jgi:hypothetical protein
MMNCKTSEKREKRISIFYDLNLKKAEKERNIREKKQNENEKNTTKDE